MMKNRFKKGASPHETVPGGGVDRRIETIIRRRMTRRGISARDIDFFLRAWRGMDGPGEQLDWQRLTPATADDLLHLPDRGTAARRHLMDLGRANLHRCAVVKLNGGRSTTMGGTVPKCMVPAKDGRSFLDIAMGQIMAANDRYGVEMPLVLMNSFFTDHVTEKIVGRTPLIIMNFIQNEYPRIRSDNRMPLDTGKDDDWCPAGHGDFFASLHGSGLLDDLLELGFRYVFISNIDNLAAEMSPLLLGRMVDGGHDFVMEVTRKTPADKKGGAPAYYRDRLSLLEIAQVPENRREEFQDIGRFGYFNTNNLWVDLKALKALLARGDLNLPIILNRKHVCDTDVIQIETAMGAGVQCFDRPGLVAVERTRFAPVKTVSDLALLQSDAFVMDDAFRIQGREPHP
jgi:UTP--glucose-1-phosphate uridylyltransferase